MSASKIAAQLIAAVRRGVISPDEAIERAPRELRAHVAEWVECYRQ